MYPARAHLITKILVSPREEYQRIKDIDKKPLIPYVNYSGIVKMKREDHTITFSINK